MLKNFLVLFFSSVLCLIILIKHMCVHVCVYCTCVCLYLLCLCLCVYVCAYVCELLFVLLEQSKILYKKTKSASKCVQT